MTRRVILLGEVVERLDMLEVRCGRCGRRADASVPFVLRAVVANCPHRDGRERERCDPYAPGLARLFVKPPAKDSD